MAEQIKEREEMMSDRLTRLIDGFVFGSQIAVNSIEWNSAKVKELADYLIANGVIVPPCKVGDTVYYFSRAFGAILPYLVENIHIAYLGEKGENCFYTFEANYNHENELLDSIDFEYDDIGKIIFLTREEVERALNNRSGE